MNQLQQLLLQRIDPAYFEFGISIIPTDNCVSIKVDNKTIITVIPLKSMHRVNYSGGTRLTLDVAADVNENLFDFFFVQP